MKYGVLILITFLMLGCSDEVVKEIVEDINDSEVSEFFDTSNNGEVEEDETINENIDGVDDLEEKEIVADINDSEEEEALSRHNEIRNAKFSDSELVWNDSLALSAQTYANSLASSGKFEHDSQNNTFGENLFASSNQTTYIDAINSWNDEEKDYDYESNSCQEGAVCGHYTQIVWRDSTELGCAMATYKENGSLGFKGGTVIVCRYNPPGNFIGQHPY